MRSHAATIPYIHLDEPGRFNSFHVNRICMIKDCQVCSETRSFYQMTQVRQSDFSQRHTLCRLSTKTENTYAEGVLAGFGVTMNVTATDQSAEEVAGRTLG